jgi:DNA repair protein RecO (recombination protein O)
VRRTTSRSAGHLEPFTLSDVLLAVGRELDVVSQADTLDAFREIREDLELTTHAFYLTELVDLLTEDRSENRAVYEILVEGLRALRETADAQLVLVTFHLRLLETLGYRPELRECVSCRTLIQPERNHFSALLGGVVCPSCGPAEPSVRAIGTSALKLLRFVQATAGQRTVNVPPHICREAEALLRDYAEHIVERRLRTPALMARIQEAGP